MGIHDIWRMPQTNVWLLSGHWGACIRGGIDIIYSLWPPILHQRCQFLCERGSLISPELQTLVNLQQLPRLIGYESRMDWACTRWKEIHRFGDEFIAACTRQVWFKSRVGHWQLRISQQKLPVSLPAWCGENKGSVVEILQFDNGPRSGVHWIMVQCNAYLVNDFIMAIQA